MQRLRRNLGGYFGERLDVGAYLREVDRLARESGWAIDRLPADDKPPLTAFRRPAPDSRLNLYVSTGIHGDEPAGPRALLELLGVERGDHHITDEHLADALELLLATRPRLPVEETVPTAG
jgi:hypothetical protein